MSIAAEIIARRWGGGGRPLAELEGRIHHDEHPVENLTSTRSATPAPVKRSLKWVLTPRSDGQTLDFPPREVVAMQVPGPFEYERATSVDHAIGLLDQLGEGAMVVAGGHSLLPMMKLRIANPEYLVDINDLAGELGYIVVDPSVVRIGAMTRHREALESDALAAVCPIFRDAERVIADPVVRNRGTVGGSLCQADPAEDLTTVCTGARRGVRGPWAVGRPRGRVSTTSSPGPTKRPWHTTRYWSRSESRCAPIAPAPTPRWSAASETGPSPRPAPRSPSTETRSPPPGSASRRSMPTRAGLAAVGDASGRPARHRRGVRAGGPTRRASMRARNRHARQRRLQAAPRHRADDPNAAHRGPAGAQRL